MRGLDRRVPALLAVLAGLAGLPIRSMSAQSHRYQVVVNAASPIRSVRRGDLSKIFLKRATQWTSGQAVVPIDLLGTEACREAFSREVHQKSVAAVKAYWQQQIFSGRDTPPPEKGSDGEVLDIVRVNPNAVGYVSADRELGPGVRALDVLP